MESLAESWHHCYGKSKMLQISNWLQQAAGPESSQSQAGTAQLPKWLQWAMRGRQRVPGRELHG